MLQPIEEKYLLNHSPIAVLEKIKQHYFQGERNRHGCQRPKKNNGRIFYIFSHLFLTQSAS